MSHVVVIRPYKAGDEYTCCDLAKEGVMSSLNSTMIGNVCRELTFQLMILFAALMFIFLSVPFTLCALVIPAVVLLIMTCTYIAFTVKCSAVQQEIRNASRIYMSNAFSCFWVAEVYEPYTMTRKPADFHYTIMPEKEFKARNIDVSSQRKKIVGCIGLLKSHRLDKGAWLKRLFVQESYQRKGIASALLQAAIDFANEQGYSCVNLVASEYNEGGKTLCLKKKFELFHMYHKQILGSVMSISMYELSYRIKPDGEDYMTNYSKKRSYVSN
ncbi:unnamed protein product [Trichogramma brassicae]|uniref:N-acetyltransferase domain-containing protein n=1 Tax=Trichogramma brassicae TaxID=86971 RepID=A0A6H5J8S5_9HYME|nr:unnamed protein product [Trichogramma brassicae]